MPIRLAQLLPGLLLAFSPLAKAQVSTGVGAARFDLDEIGRWGVSGSLYIPAAGQTFDVIPNFEFYSASWSVDGAGLGSDTSDVYALSVDIHANLPALGDRARAYVGSGLTYAGYGGNGTFGLNLAAGIFVRPVGWKFFPYGQVTYRLMPEFDNAASLELYYFRGGLRIVL